MDPPATPSFYAFSYTVPSEDRMARSFVAAGSGEAHEGGPSYEGRIIRRGDQSPEAMREKARFVLGAIFFHVSGLTRGRPETPQPAGHSRDLTVGYIDLAMFGRRQGPHDGFLCCG
jgi:hypothetical protein